jgi:uncharacterized protein
MQNWEEQRDLFPTRKRAAEMPPSRQRIRPNFYARLARFCAENANFVLITAMFLIAIALSLTAFNVRFDFKRPIEISRDIGIQAANQELQKEFPVLDSLIVMRISADAAAPAKTAAQFLANTLQTDKANVAHVFIPGIGPFYDRFGILYLDATEIETRVQHTAQLKPLFQALALSPNLAGLSALVTQVATAVKGGRSPQGLEDLFLQVSTTIRKLAEGKPAPLDWRAVAGLSVESKKADWVVIVEPRPGKLVQARQAVKSLVQSTLQAQDTLKIVADFPPEPAPKIAGSMTRQVVVFSALALLFLNLLLVFALQNLRLIMLVSTPIFVGIIMGFATASLLVPQVDRVVVTFVFASMLPIAAISCCMGMALAKPRSKPVSSVTSVMLAAQDTGSLVLAMAGIVIVMWFAWVRVEVASLAALAATVTTAVVAGLAAILTIVPSLATLLPQAPERQPVRIMGENSLVIWRKIRPLLAFSLMALSLFCVVFFSSLHFSNAATSDVTRGLQFLAGDEKSAVTLSSDLKTVPEVGTVRWMGTFMPQDIERKQKLLQGLSGALIFTGEGGTVGPHDLVTDLQDIEIGLRTITDEAQTDEALRVSAHEFRRSLAVLSNTTTNIEPVAIELEQLIFAKFADLPKVVDDLAGLPAPQPADFDVNLRKLFVSDAGKWRVEALPKRVIPTKTFIDAARRVGVTPLGPLVAEQAELNTLESIFTKPIAISLLVSLLIALVYLQKIIDWLTVVVAALMPFALFAALAVTTNTAIEPLTIPAVIMAATASIFMALLTIVRKRRLHVPRLSIFLPVAMIMAIILPLQLLQIKELGEFSRSLTALLICVVVFNLVIVRQLSAWADNRKKSRPRLQEQRAVTKSQKDLRNNVF